MLLKQIECREEKYRGIFKRSTEYSDLKGSWTHKRCYWKSIESKVEDVNPCKFYNLLSLGYT